MRVGELLDAQDISNLIKSNKLELIDRQSNIITRWKFKYKDKDYMIVYDKKTNQPATIMPYREGMENYDNKSQYFWWLLKH